MERAFVIAVITATAVFSQTAGTALLQQTSQQGERALAEGRYAEAEAAYEKLRQLSPNIAEVHARLGLIYFQEKKFQQAVPELRQAIKLKPSLPNTDVLLAMSLSELDHFSEALPGLEKGFRRSSDPVLKRMSGLQLERAYTGLQKDAKAVEVAMELAKAYPDDPEVLYHGARLFGNFAYLNLKRLGEVAPESVWRHQAAGEANESQGEYDMAVMEYKAVLTRDPSRAGIHYRVGRALLSRSAKSGSTSEGQEPAREFEQELQLDPTNANAAYELGEMDRKSEQYAKARELFEAAVKYDPEFEDAEIGLGRTLLLLGKADLALPHLQKAIALNPKNEVTYYQLSQVYRAMGKREEQRKALAEFQRIRSQKADRPAPAVSPREVTRQEIDPAALSQ